MKKKVEAVIWLCLLLTVVGCSNNTGTLDNAEKEDLSTLNENTQTEDETPEENVDNTVLSIEEIVEFKELYSGGEWRSVNDQNVNSHVCFDDADKEKYYDDYDMWIHGLQDKEVFNMDYGPKCDITFGAFFSRWFGACDIENIKKSDESTYIISTIVVAGSYADEFGLDKCTFVIVDVDQNDDVLELTVQEIGLKKTMYKRHFVIGEY